MLAPAFPVLAEDDFFLTYHVERMLSDDLSLEECSSAVERAAGQADLTSRIDDYPGQLAVVTGGTKGVGAFVVQCIAVDDRTVTVVQGMDYRQAKGDLGRFADRVHSELLDAAASGRP
ncbi:DUF6180 family protein [Paracoccus sp. SSK6]|uniref:DUF6180 family protein n=1 Tax=Paracoccus sp. SSK6 TaxID=3143131 RepID=UPI00321B0CD9